MQIGQSAVDFELKDAGGSLITLNDIAGSGPVAIVFSCNHCPYVLAWEDRIIDIGRQYGARGVGFALINANDSSRYPADSFEEMGRRARLKSYPFPYLHDESQSTARAYGAERTPEVFLFDSDRKLAYHGAPDDNYDDPLSVKAQYLRDALEAVLEGRVPEPPQTPAVGCTIKWK